MDALRAAVEARRKAADRELGGKRYAKRSEIEELRLKRIREEEEAEARVRAAKATKRGGGDAVPGRPASRGEGEGGSTATPSVVPSAPSRPPRAEVIRRLRRVREPATLFGEGEEERWARLQQAEKSVKIADEDAGGQQANLHVELEREARLRARKLASDLAAGGRGSGGGGGATGAAAADGEAGAVTGSEPASGSGSSRPGTPGTAGAPSTPVDPETMQLEAAFRAAAAAAAESALPVPDRVAARLRGWVADWEQDLAARPPEAAASPEGRRASVRFEETRQYLRPLFDRLRRRDLDKEVLAAILLITDAIRERNYLHAYRVYMGLAIGNAAWPIGVTQVGLHDRSAREKISFKFNASAAHIMNDEAMRKFIQALKRIMTFCQRRYPTDPSRSVDFDGASGGAGRGSAGGGSDRLALLEAAARGDELAPAPAPTHLDASGAVKIPLRWEHQIRGAIKEVEKDLGR